MHTYKIIPAIMIAASLLCSCGGNQTSDDVIASLKDELKEAKESNKVLQEQYINQNQEMTEILSELNAITGRTATLKLDVENGSARMTQADQISASIQTLKERVATLEKSNKALKGKNGDFAKMVDEFNKVIESQEAQIDELKAEIQSKDKTIKSQKDTISNQYSTIVNQRNQLREMVAKEAKSLCSAGEELEQIADNAPEVSWKKNKQKIGDMAQSIYKKALEYYQMSLAAGYTPAQEHIDAISAKIK